MTPSQFKDARNALGLTQTELANVWSMGKNGGRSIRKWESGDIPVNPIAAFCIQMMVANYTWVAHTWKIN